MIRGFQDAISLGACTAWTLLVVIVLSLIGATGAPTARADGPAALKIGFLTDFSGGAAEASRDRKRAFELAIEHVNGGGGVLGMPVAVAVGRTTGEPETAVAEARRLVEIEGVHAIVGPNSSAGTLPVAERVTGPAGIPTVTFSATSPQLTTAADNDFLFRTALSDVAQGPVLARVVRERGLDNVGLLYIDDPWGRGLAGSFEAAWTGAVRAVGFERGRTGFLTRLRETAAGGAQALVVIAGGRATGIIVREAIDSGLYDRFAFGDGAKRLDLVRSIGGACTAPGRRRPPTAPRRRRGRRPMSPSTGRCRFWPARPPSRRNSAITSPEVSCRPIAINCGRSRGTVGSWSSSHRDLRAGRTDRFAVNGTGAVRRGTIS